MPGQRVRPHTADFVNLGELGADRSGHRDRSNLQTLLGGELDGQEPGSDVVARSGRLPVGAQARRAVRQIGFGRDEFQTIRRDVINNGFSLGRSGEWTDIAAYHEGDCAGSQQRCQDY